MRTPFVGQVEGGDLGVPALSQKGNTKPNTMAQEVAVEPFGFLRHSHDHSPELFRPIMPSIGGRKPNRTPTEFRHNAGHAEQNGIHDSYFKSRVGICRVDGKPSNRPAAFSFGTTASETNKIGAPHSTTYLFKQSCAKAKEGFPEPTDAIVWIGWRKKRGVCDCFFETKGRGASAECRVRDRQILTGPHT